MGEGGSPNSHGVRLPFLEIDIRDGNFLQSVLDVCNQKASEELCTAVPFTWRDDIVDPFDEERLVELLHANPVPGARTHCITDEAVTNIGALPRGTCTGTVFDDGGSNDEC